MKRKPRPPLWYPVQAVIGTLIEEAAVVAIVLLLLPRFGIHIPAWAVVLLMVVVAVLSYVTYRVGRPTFFLRPRVSAEAIMGREGRVVRPLAPEGYVKVRGELWKARCDELALEAGSEVVVVGIDGLRLVVSPKRQGRATRSKEASRAPGLRQTAMESGRTGRRHGME